MKKQLMTLKGLMFSVCLLMIQLIFAGGAVAAQGRATIAEPVNRLGTSLNTGPTDPSISRSDEGKVVTLSLRSLGLPTRLRLVGAKVESNIDFSFHTLDVVERLRLKVRYEYSPTLNPELSTLTVLLNGKPVGALPLLRENSRDAHATLEIDPILLQEWNHLTFHLDAHLEAPMCDDPRNPQIWVQMNSKDTVIEANVATLPLTNDLSLFPVPFFDKHDTQDLKLHFVLPAHPSWSALKSAGILSSWFGSQTDWRKVHFPTHLNEIPPQDAIVLATAGDSIDGITLPPVTDGVATVSMVDNPKNPDARLLLVVGRDEKGLIEAAQALALGKVKLEGSIQSVQALSLPKRQPLDAPNWVPSGKKVKLGDIVPADKLSANGLFVTPYQMVLQLPPDLYRSESQSIPFDFSFDSNNNSRYVVRVDALINGKVFDFKSFSEPEKSTVPVKENETPMLRRKVLFNIPTQKLTGKDTITVQFVFADKSHDICNTAFVTDVIRVDPNSTIDLRGLSRYVTLPDLSYLAYSGFPFSKMADLSETAVLLPAKPDRHEIESMLITLGHIGNKTGYPATAVTIASIQDAEKFADKDMLVVGAAGNIRPLMNEWSGAMQVNVESDIQPIPAWGDRYLQRWAEWITLATFEKEEDGAHGMVLAGFESPLQSERSVVMLTAQDSSKLPEEASVLNTFIFAKDFIGDVVHVEEKDTFDRVDGYQRSPKYSIGELPLLELAKKFVQHNPWLAVLLAAVMGLFFASMSYRKLKRVSQEKSRQESM